MGYWATVLSLQKFNGVVTAQAAWASLLALQKSTSELLRVPPLIQVQTVNLAWLAMSQPQLTCRWWTPQLPQLQKPWLPQQPPWPPLPLQVML